MGVGGQRDATAASTRGMTRYPLYRRLDRPHGRSEPVRKIFQRSGFDPRAVQNIASRYTDWAIPAHTLDFLYVWTPSVLGSIWDLNASVI